MKLDDTKKAYIIANFPIVASVCLTLFTALIMLIFKIGPVNQAEGYIHGSYTIECCQKLFLLFTVPLFFGYAAARNPTFTNSLVWFIFSCIPGISLWAFFVFLFMDEDLQSEAVAKRQLIIACIFSVLILIGIIVVSIRCARYAGQHFDEVVSRRMLYRNSNVDIFDTQWKYTFNCFVSVFLWLFFAIPSFIMCIKGNLWFAKILSQ